MLILKFGGKVLLDLDKVSLFIQNLLISQKKLIVVVSAIGRFPFPYATDTFINESINLSKDEKNRLISMGENISSLLVSNHLNGMNINAYAPSVNELKLCYNDQLKIGKKIKKLIKNYDVLVVPGFIALKKNKLTLLPRGGSNITACFIALYFNIDLIIITDVDGIYSKDPNVSNSIKYRLISCDQLFELTKDNQSFFPKLAINYIKKGNFKVLVRNIDNENGTYITK